MANILQAAKWMQERELMSRRSEPFRILSMSPICSNGYADGLFKRFHIIANQGFNPELDGMDLLAEDWEIAND